MGKYRPSEKLIRRGSFDVTDSRSEARIVAGVRLTLLCDRALVPQGSGFDGCGMAFSAYRPA
jgi:hypothetical protein